MDVFTASAMLPHPASGGSKPHNPHPKKKSNWELSSAALSHNKSAMSSRSRRNSFSVAVIMPRLKSLMARSWTIR